MTIFTQFLRNALVCFFLLFATGVFAQLGDVNYDNRIKKQLDDMGMKYTITDKGNFKIVYELDGGRTQMVLIYSKTYEYAGMEIREITSTAASADTKTAYTQSNLFILLEKNETYKLGAWQMNGGSAPYLLQFALRISATTNQTILKELLVLAAKKADEMEQLLVEGDKY